MKILIVGGGIGGLALAGFLKDSDIEYRIIEKKPDWSHQGYSLGMWQNGRAMLEKLGLRELFDAHCVPMHALDIHTGAGKRLRHYDLSDFYSSYGLAYAHIRRADLHDWLMTTVDPKKVSMGLNVTDIRQVDTGVFVTFSDGSSGRYDLVVGADGMHSKVRELAFGGELESWRQWRAWYAWVDTKFAKAKTVSEYIGPGRYAVFFNEGDKALAIFVAHVDHTIRESNADEMERLKRIFSDDTYIKNVLETISPADILPTDLAEVSLHSWHTDRVALLGDAAHGFEPFAGLGGSMAMEDAYVLAHNLLSMPKNPKTEGSLRETLAIYERRRRQRIGRARMLTHRIRLWSLVASKWRRGLVNICLPFLPSRIFVDGYKSLLEESI